MKYGIYTAPRRVERDGRLVCFAGERMTMEEAARRGLLDGREPAPANEPAEPAPANEPAEPGETQAGDPGRAKELVGSNSLKELQAMADALGAEYPKGANKSVIADAIAAAELAKG